MKKRYELTILATLAMGVLAALLRFLLLSFGYDERHLLIPHHPASILCWLVTAAAVGLILFLTARTNPMTQYGKTFPPSIYPMIGGCFAMAGMIIRAISEFRATSGILAFACLLSGILGALALLFASYCRFTGKRPSCYCMAAAAIYFMLLLVSGYRSWMAQSQPEEYLLALLFHICLMLSSFHRAVLDNGGKGLRKYLRYALLALFFGIGALPGNRNWLYTASLVLYLAAELIFLQLPKRKKALRQSPERQ